MSSGLRQRKAAPAKPSPSSQSPVSDAKPALPSPAPLPKAAVVSEQFKQLDWVIAFALLLIGLYSRLWNLGNPRRCVFDETHFTKFATWYVSGHYYVDIHPPLAKLIFAWVLQARGWLGAEEEFVEWWTKDGFVGTVDWKLLYEDKWGSEYLPLRQTAAITGALFIVLGYVSARLMGCLRMTSLLAACMLGMEGISLLQSRAILCDIFLYTFDLATLAASFASVRSGLSEKQQFVWCGVTGVLLGCCMSVKLTALGILATVGLHQALCLYVSRRGAWWSVLGHGVKRAVLILAPATVIFFGLWTLHLYILPYSGQGDGFMSDTFKSTLVPKTFPHKAKCPNHEYAKRWDCGFVGITQDACVAKGCCWDPTSPKAWCYYTSDPSLNATTGPDFCPNRANTWSDCKHLDPAACAAAGCCWDPKSTKAWCYHKGVLERPVLSWWYKVKETLRATWANNDGGAVMIHEFMSEWWEWPFMLGNTVPFAPTDTGGFLKALGNPGVHWTVAACVIVCTLVGAVASGKLALYAFGVAGPSGVTSSPLYSEAVSVNENGGGGWVIPLFTLLFGYYLNLVPYQLIKRSKFVYHYVPALIVGVMFTVFVCDCVLRWGRVRARARGCWHRTAVW